MISKEKYIDVLKPKEIKSYKARLRTIHNIDLIVILLSHRESEQITGGTGLGKILLL